MSYSAPIDYVSIIGTSLLQPIVNLFEDMDSLNLNEPNEVQASSLENGYSAAITALTVVIIESFISRTQYIRGEKPPKRPMDFLQTTYPASGLADILEELFVVRDVIVHNHVWEIKFLPDELVGMKLVSAELRGGYGDKKFKNVLNPQNRKTRKLSINLLPTKICRTDAVIVFKNALKFLLFLEGRDRRYVYISKQYVQFKGNPTLFTDFVARL